MVHCGQGSSARLRFWTKTLFRRGTMNAIIGVMSALNPLGRISLVFRSYAAAAAQARA